MKRGFKCGVGLFRGSLEIPITSFKVTCAASNDDVREIIDYIHFKYAIDKNSKKKVSRLYAYGSSLGGILLGRYLQSTKSKKLDGAGIFCAPYDVAKGHDYFYSCCYGMYSYMIG